MAKKEKVFVPSYHMSLAEYCLLLHFRMEQRGCKNITGLTKAFFEPATYARADKLIKSLVKKDLVAQSGDALTIREGLLAALDGIISSARCAVIAGPLLQKKGQLLSVYHAAGSYIGVLQDPKDTVLVMHEDVQAIYEAFAKQIEAAGAAPDFKPEGWKQLWEAPGSKLPAAIQKPTWQAGVQLLPSAVPGRKRTATMVADKTALQVISGAADAPYTALVREQADPADRYGCIVRELELLKDTAEGKDGAAPQPPKQPSEYQKITSVPGFPKSGLGFVFWSLKRTVKTLPGMVVDTVKSRWLSLLLYVVWGAALVLLNLYNTCYINDTFMFNVRGRWGDWTPYLMAGTVNGPLQLKGFQADIGVDNTVFLIWPLAMVITLLGRHIIRRCKATGFGWIGNLFRAPGQIAKHKKSGFGTGRAMWLTLALSWAMGFFVMNPITMFLTALLAMLVTAQGTASDPVQMLLLWGCAHLRKRVDAGRHREPDSRSYLMFIHNIGKGFFIYGLASMVLWYTVDYHPWARLIASLLMVVYALIQAFAPGLLKKLFQKPETRNTVQMLVAVVALGWLCAGFGVAFAHDGGWTESGSSIAGLLQNAGFGTILGLSAAILIGAFGGPIAWAAGVGIVLGGGSFLTGLTNTRAGQYVRDSSRQFFFGTEPGEDKTLLCAGTEILNFAAGLVNPAKAVTNNMGRFLAGGKLVSDGIGLVGDSVATGKDIVDYMNGDPNVGLEDLAWDVVGLGFDICGLSDDVDDVADMFSKSPEMDADTFRNIFKNVDDTADARIRDMEADVGVRRQAELDRVDADYQKQMESINAEREKVLQDIRDAKPADGPFTHQERLQQLEESGLTADRIRAQEVDNINKRYDLEITKNTDQIHRDALEEKIRDSADKVGRDLTEKVTTEEGLMDTASEIYDIADMHGGPDLLKQSGRGHTPGAPDGPHSGGGHTQAEIRDAHGTGQQANTEAAPAASRPDSPAMGGQPQGDIPGTAHSGRPDTPAASQFQGNIPDAAPAGQPGTPVGSQPQDSSPDVAPAGQPAGPAGNQQQGNIPDAAPADQPAGPAGDSVPTGEQPGRTFTTVTQAPGTPLTGENMDAVVQELVEKLRQQMPGGSDENLAEAMREALEKAMETAGDRVPRLFHIPEPGGRNSWLNQLLGYLQGSGLLE